jgi:hypothetical protein
MPGAEGLGHLSALSLGINALQQGLAVFPVSKKDKSPLTPKGHSWEEVATSEEDTLHSLLPPHLNYLIAAIPGPDYIVIDVDVKPHTDGSPSQGLASFQRLRGDVKLPNTAHYKTRSGGYHIWYQKDANLTIGNDNDEWDKLYPDIDIRADKGYVALHYDINLADVVPASKSLVELFERVGMTGERSLPASEYDHTLLEGDILATVKQMEAWGWQAYNLIQGTEYSKEAYQVRMRRTDSEHGQRGACVGFKHPEFIEIFTPNWLVPKGHYDLAQLQEMLKEAEEWPVASEECYYGILGEITEALQDSIEADPIHIYATLLTCVAASLEGPVIPEQPGIDLHLNMFSVMVTFTASGKGASWSTVKPILKIADPVMFDPQDSAKNRVVGGFGSGEAFVDLVYTLSQAELGQVTNQSGTMSIRADRRVLIKESEFAKITSAANREGSTLSQNIRDAFDGEPLQARKRKEQQVALEHYVSVFGQVTIGELERCITANDALNGFANRHWWVLGRPAGHVPQRALEYTSEELASLSEVEKLQIDVGEVEEDRRRQERLEKLAFRLRAALDGARKIERIKLLPSVKPLHAEMDLELRDYNPGGLASSILGRSRVYLYKMAGVLAALDGSQWINVDHLNAAYALLKHNQASVEYLWKGKEVGVKLGKGALKDGNTPEAERTLDKLIRILQTNGGELENGLLQRGAKYFNSTDRKYKAQAFDLGTSKGLIEIVEQETKAKGLPKKIIRLRGNS